MKLIRTTLITAILLNFLTVSLPQDAYSEAISLPLSGLQLAIQDLKKPKDIAKFMKENFKFKDDQKLFGTTDYWQSPEEFWNQKKGDCEDYALLSQYILDQKGIEAYVVSFYGDRGYAHTVTVYKEENRYNVINEDRHYRYRAKSLEKALSRVHRNWMWGAIAKQNGARGWMVRQLQNPSYNPQGDFRSNFSDYPF